MSKKTLEPQLPREDQKQRSRDRIINLLLQGIIAANPHHSLTATPEARLAKAREALLGEKPSKGRKAIKEDVKLFPLLDDALKADRDQMHRLLMSAQKPEVQAQWKKELAEEDPSLRRIAKKHAPEFAKPSVLPESTEDWLRRAIKEMSVTGNDMAELEGLFRGDSPKAERLRRILEDLQALGIASCDPLGRNGPI